MTLHHNWMYRRVVSHLAVLELVRYSDTEDRLDIMARMLEWRHIAPTSPDTLVSYPFKMDDPFALTATPHVLFAGNQPTFGQRLVTGALMSWATKRLRVSACLTPDWLPSGLV